MTADDEDVADMLRKSGKPVMLVVNKIDNIKSMDNIYEFYNLGIGDPIGVSSVNLLNFGDLLEELCKLFPDPDAEEEDVGAIQIAVVGKPNVGKSSLVNRILGEDRVMVSDIAGTTRDAIDTRFTADDGQDYVIIDTAGIRRKRAIEYQSLERFSIVRALAAIDRCDVALMLIDATQGVTEQDSKIAGYVDEKGKAAIIVVNKWDAVPDKETNTMRDIERAVRDGLAYMQYAPIHFISALTGARVDKLFEMIQSVSEQNNYRIPTGQLNSILAEATARVQPPTDKGRRLKIYYMTQASTKPPHFVIFCNDARLFHFSYQRYLENQIRDVFGLKGTPVRITIRQKGEKEE
jgi:GTP-binding protein